MPVCVITNLRLSLADVPLLASGDSLVSVAGNQEDNRQVKASILEYSPFAKSIFIDSDTVVLGDLVEGAKYLEYFDVAARLNPYPQERRGKGDVTIFEGLTVRDCPHWNSGVLLFRRSAAAQDFFARWAENYALLRNPYDQVAFVKTVFEHGARVLSLDARWNATDPIVGRRGWRRSTKIFHYASNISDRLVRSVARVDREVLSGPLGASSETERFLLLKRSSKREELGLSKYLVAKALWRLSSPV